MLIGGVSATGMDNLTSDQDIDKVINQDSDEILTVEESSAGSDDSGLKELENKNNILKASNDNDTLGKEWNVTEKTFDSIQKVINNAISGDTIYLDGLYTGSKTININTPYLTLIGKNDTVLDAQGLTSIFGINTNHITLKNIKLINAKADYGAVAWYGANGKIINLSFFNNTANQYGGGMLWYGSNGTVINSTFINNNATLYGGAVIWFGDSGNLINSTFIDNTATTIGGGVAWTGNYGTILNSTFINNSATAGGGFYYAGNSGDLINSTFINNTAIVDGGAVYWIGDSGNLINSTFINNTATNFGGGVCWIQDGGNMINSTFINNSAGLGGGTNWIGRYGNLINSTFLNNTAKFYGGGLYMFSDSRVSYSSFCNNTAHFGGGAFLIQNIILLNSYFSNNYAYYGGGGVLASAQNPTKFATNIIIKNSIFENNSASNYGGAISVINTTLDNVTVNNNSANVGGGAYVFNSTIKNSKFYNNIANNGTDIYYLGNIILTNNSIGLDIKRLNSSFRIVQESFPFVFVDGQQYFGFCIEPRGVETNYGFYDNSLQEVVNKLNKKLVSEYLKILVYTYINSTNITNSPYLWTNNTSYQGIDVDLSMWDGNMILSPYVWIFTEGEYWKSEDPVIMKVISLYDSGFRVPSVNATKLLSNGTLMIFNFSSLVTPLHQNAFIFSICYQNYTNLSVDKKVLNKTIFSGKEFEYVITVYNSGNQTLDDVYVVDDDYTSNIQFVRFVNGTGNWIYSNESITVTDANSNIKNVSSRWILTTPLKPGENRTIVLIFKALNNGTVVNNVTSGFKQFELCNDTDVTVIYNPNMTVEKISLTPEVLVGSLTTFMILVSNTGDYNLTGVYVNETYYKGLEYHSYKGNNWTKLGDKFIYDGVLHVGETIGFNITFKALHKGNFTNIVIAGSNETDNKTTNNTTVVKELEVGDNNTSENKTYLENKTIQNNSIENKTNMANKTTPNESIEGNSYSKNHKNIIFDKKSTGNPILLLLLVLFIIPIRRFKK